MADDHHIARMARALCVADGRDPEEVIHLGTDEVEVDGQTYTRDVLVPAWATYVSEARLTIAAAENAGVDRVMPTERFIADKATIRAELERRAKARHPITYGEAAALVGRTVGGLRPILNAIQAEDVGRGRPNLTALVVTVSTGLPSGVGAEQEARARAIAVQDAVFAAWAEQK